MDHPQYGDLSLGQAAQMHFYADSDLMDLFTNLRKIYSISVCEEWGVGGKPRMHFHTKKLQTRGLSLFTLIE